MQFQEVIGQAKTKQKLIDSVRSNRIPHAQLIFGPEGSGTLALAIAYAQYVACTDRQENDACGVCPSCIKYNKLAHPDLHFAFPVNTTKKISKDPVSDDFIEEWREFVIANPYFRSSQWYEFMGLENKQGAISRKESDAIIRKLSLKSYESDYKVMIVWLPEKMNATSANILLKLIEEPPEKTLFLFVSENPEHIILTIRSRLQPIKLEPVDNESMSAALQQKFNLDQQSIENTVRLASGNFIKASEVIEITDENAFNLEKFTTIMRLVYARDFMKINEWVDEMASIGRERLKSFFDYALRMIRENFMMHMKDSELVYMTNDENAFSQKFYPYINGRNVIAIANELGTASSDIERNAYAKIVLFDMALKMVKLIRS